MSFVRAVRLRVPAGSAKPGPALGQALGPLGINMVDFCKKFNEQSLSASRMSPIDPTQKLHEGYLKDTPLNVILYANSDRTYTFTIRSPSTSYLIQRHVSKGNASGMKGTSNPTPDATKAHGYISPLAIYEIAQIKQMDDNMWHLPLESIARSIVGTCRSMGIHVREE